MIDYKGEYKKQVANNLKQVLSEIESSDMKFKIENWATKFGYSFDEIKAKNVDDEVFRCVFIKEPGRQSFHQKVASLYIQGLQFVENFKVLPSGGKNAIYLTSGKLFDGKTLKAKSKDIKSIDFTWRTGKIIIYASHKYTGINGGTQDNQYHDIQAFLNHARDCNDANVIFLAICDGDYYLQKDSKTGDETKLKRLERLTDGKRVFALNTNQLSQFLKSLITN